MGREEIRERVLQHRSELKRIRSLIGSERKIAAKHYRESLKKEKAENKKSYKKFRRAHRRPIVLSVWGLIILTPLLILGISYIAAKRPPSSEILVAREMAREVAAEVQAEGSILLLNKDSVLPLKGSKVNIFGTRSVTPSFGGGGSGSINSADAISFYEALDEAGIETNNELFNLYANWRFKGEISTESYTIKKKKSFMQVILPNIFGIMGTERYNKLDADDIPPQIISNAKQFSDTAIMMVGSFSRETVNDTKYSDKTPEALTLSPEDRKHLELLNREFSNIIILVNTGNAMEMGWIEEYENIKSVLWIGYPGAVGFQGVVDLLTGEKNPSGRLTDTLVYDVTASPATKLVGHFPYENLEGQGFVNYNEGIYVGYRYFETYFKDDEAGYNKTVQFPFGYGLSYTDFKWETTAFNYNEDSVDLSVKVTNSGDISGKDVVQIYFTAPWYKESGIEKSYINLVDYAKTNLLEPGQSEIIKINFPISDMSSYDYKNREAWIVEKGSYQVKIARNIHDIVDTKELVIKEDIISKQDSVTGTEINNLFNDAHGDLEYVTRADFDGSFSSITDFNYTAPQSVIDATEYKVTKTEGTLPTFGAKNSIVLKDLKGLDITDNKWESFLDQFTLKELMELVSNGGFQSIGNSRLGIPQTLHYDGPASIRHYFGKWSTIGFPNAVIVAQSWNDQLQEEMAVAMTREGRLRGIDIWYAPAMNIHRTPLGARNFEYYSEDPLLSGRVATAMTNGAHKMGMGVTLKHFALYTQETNRTGGFNWINEQALREIYLKPFEISTKEAGAYGVMSSMPRIGHTWSGENSALLNDLLRDEWGFKGFVVTDITIGEYMKAYNSVTNGNDLMLTFSGGLNNTLFSGGHIANLKEAYELDPVGTANGLRTSVRNILYMVLQTEAVE